MWRAVSGPESGWPLALLDYRSLDLDSDLETSDVIHKDRIGESFRCYFNDHHRWHFQSRQCSNEVVVFRTADSRGIHVPCTSFRTFRYGMVGPNLTVVALHLAFEISKVDMKMVPRESIEVRVACFFRP